MPAVASETIQCPSDGFTIRAFLAYPAQAPASLPVLVILHEWWGLNDHIKDLTRRFAQDGYLVAAIDLYSRFGHKVTSDATEAAALMSALSSQAALRDVNATIAHLRGQPHADPRRLGVIGFCMGGTLALTMATHNSDVKAAVSFYGKVPPLETLESLVCPVLYHYGAKDGWVTKQEADRLAQGLSQYGKPGVVHIYPEAQHAFCNDTRPEVYRPADAKLAWERTLRFFRQHL